jgi:hypothetical protein
MLPFSTDWFMSWQPNIHASLFMAFYRFVRLHAKQEDLDAIVQAYRLYNEHIESFEMEQVLEPDPCLDIDPLSRCEAVAVGKMHLLRRRIRSPRL